MVVIKKKTWAGYFGLALAGKNNFKARFYCGL